MVFKKSFSRFFISNKSKFVPEKVFLRGVLLHYFNMKKTAAESHRILVEVYDEHVLILTWKTKNVPGSRIAELETILKEDPCQMQEDHFQPFQCHGIDFEARKLCIIRVEANRR